MMEGNPNWRGMSGLIFQPQQPSMYHPQSWSQLLMGGLETEEDYLGISGHFHQHNKKLDNWEDHQILNPSSKLPVVDVNKKQKLYGHGDGDELHTYAKNRRQDLSSEFKSTAPASKKARVQSSSNQPPLNAIRKEKLMDRVRALHQLVSPFGKTDTASVLSESIAHIRFLHAQIQALSSSFHLSSVSANSRHQHSVLNDDCLKRRGAFKQDGQDIPEDLRSRGLCLVPVSTTHLIGDDNIGPEFWSPALGGGF
ncbi:hypothetical protein NMG60_11002570 [Bertholletia excelsa]